MSVPTLLQLAQSGAHYGHHRSMVFPKARQFVYTIKQNVALINLEQTQQRLAEAQKVLAEHLAQGKTVLFVGTKRSIRDILKTVSQKSNSPYITEHWIGGFLTNFDSIQENIKRMNELEEFLVSEKSQKLTKIARLRQQNKLDRYHRFLSGVSKLSSRPDMLVLASATQDKTAVREANFLGIPIVAICDTDINPDKIAYPIPANDDAPKAVELILNALTDINVKSTEKPKAGVKAKEVIETVQPKEVVKATKKPAAAKKVAKKTAVKKVAVKAKK